LGEDFDGLRLRRRDPRGPYPDAQTLSAHVQVKAAGGVRDLDALLAARALGVSRCGATRTAGILDEARRRLGLSPIKVGEAAAQPAGD